MRPAPSSLARLRSLVSSLSDTAARRAIPLSILAGAAASVVVGAGVAHAIPDPSDTMPLADVKPGMKGYGLTVMSGTTPEKFDVEVISVLHNFRPHQDLVLIKTPHPRLNIARTVGGMSGSPIFLNNKMIGAYAYGWLFGVEPIAGVTPIKSMLEDQARPVPRTLFPAIGGAPLPQADARALSPGKRASHAFLGAPDHYDLAEHGKQLAARSSHLITAPDGAGLARASTPVMLGGLSNAAIKAAGELLTPLGLDPLQAGGSGSATQDPTAPTKFENGGGIAVQLIRGDVSAQGIGTVTRVDGDRLVAFGHPMLGGGVEALPTAIAKVHWILASTNRSFKIGEPVRPLGTLVNDRQAAIVVDSSIKAPTFPVKVTIQGVDGAPKPVWDMEVAHDQFMAPTFTALAIGSALEETTAERRDVTWRAVTKIKVAKHGSFSVLDFGAGAGNPLGVDEFIRGRLTRSVGMLLNNPWEPVMIEGVETTVRISFAREIWSLRGAKVLTPEIDAGQSVQIRLELQPYQGKLESKVIEVKIPAELAGRDLEIDLSPGYEVERPLATPDSVNELMANLQAMSFDPESIVATFRLRESGAAYKGKVATRLPPAALDLLRPATQSDAPEFFASQVQTAIPLKRFLVGRDSVRVSVRPVLR